MFRVFSLFLVLLMASLSAQESLPPQDESFDPAILKEPTLPILDKTLIYEIITDLSPTMSPSGGGRFTPNCRKKWLEGATLLYQRFFSGRFHLSAGSAALS